MSKEIAPAKTRVTLSSKEDVVDLLEKAATDIRETPTSIAQANARLGIAKARMGLEKQHVEYMRFKDKHGTSIHDSQTFFGYNPKQPEKK